MPFCPVTGSKSPIEWDKCVGPDFSQWEGPDEGEQNPPFLKRGKQMKTGGGKSPMSDWDVPKALFEDLLSSLCQEESRAADTALPDEGEELLW